MGDDASAPDPYAGAHKLFDLVGLTPVGEHVNTVNDVWKAFEHGTKAFEHGDPKAITDVMGDAGHGLATALKNTPRILEKAGRWMETAGKKSGIDALEQFGKQVFSKGGSRLASELATAAETPIIADALLALTVMGLELGFGDPDSGDRFGDGSSKFQQACELLETAFPTAWEGSGSQAYIKQNTKQQDRTEIMADADNMMHGIVQNEARQLKETQDVIDIASDILNACIPAAIALYFIPEVGPPMSLAFQAGAVAGAMPLPTARMAQMAFQALQNAGQVQQAIGKYNEVVSTAHPTGSLSAFCPSPGTPGTTGGPGKSGTPGPGKSGSPSGPSKPGSPGGPTRSGSPTGPGRSGSPSGPAKPSSPGGPGQSGAPSTPGTPSAPTGPSAPTTPSAPSAPTAPSMLSQPSAPTAPSTPASPGTPSTRNVPWVTTTPSGGGTPVATAFSGQTGGGGLASTTPPVQPVTPGAGPGPSVPKPPAPQMVPGAGPDPSKLPPMGRAPVSHEIETDTGQVEERAT